MQMIIKFIFKKILSMSKIPNSQNVQPKTILTVVEIIRV